MDDFPNHGTDFNAYLSYLQQVLVKCQDKKLVLNQEKCHFMVNQGIVLGHVVSRQGTEVDPTKFQVISSLSTSIMSRI